MGYVNIPYFVSPLSNVVLQTKIPGGHKIPKFTKFSDESREFTPEHMARYQMPGYIENDKLIEIKYISSLLTNDAFT